MRRMYSENQLKDVIKEEVERGQLENAKPLYFHPIFLTSTNQYVRLAFVVLNNSATAFTTFNEVITYFRSLLSASLTTIRVPTTGACKYDESVMINCQINITASNVEIFGMTVGGTLVNLNLASYLTETVVDGVNKIN